MEPIEVPVVNHTALPEFAPIERDVRVPDPVPAPRTRRTRSTNAARPAENQES